ncbi:centrosomal protein of 63 kDa isoform X4 [Manis javanica]|uniref:centrosomal protein of 63 kDa isoform X4 n=1 Tax=Manis javanica TaxID=9974 RepID=UPI003C6D1E89
MRAGLSRPGRNPRYSRPASAAASAWLRSPVTRTKGMEALLEGIQNRGRDEEFLTSCEAELQELMKQIDIMVAHKKSEWEGQTHALEACLDIRERELKTLRSQLDTNHKEIGILHQQAEEHEKVKQEMAMEYKQELKKLHEELGRLKRSYEKLQKKHIRDFRGNVKNHREDRSEIERLTGKIEEFRQKSLDWEKQRLIYQQQVSSLEAQRKALAEQSEIIQAQLANWKQKLESVELSSQSEIQHLSCKLERANDTICANELEIERLTMRVNDLVGTNMTVTQEQQQKEEKLRESEKLLEVLQEEKRKLKAALQSQENFHEARMQKKKLQAKLRTTEFQYTVEAIRSLEEPQTERRYTCQGQEESDNVLSHLNLTHNSEELLQAEVTRLESSLESVSATCKQLSQELMEKYEELKKMEVHNNEYRAEIKKEVLDQMESLKLENHHLSEIVMKLELGLHEAKEVSLADLQENYTEALNKLVSENQQLQKDLMNTKSKLEVSTQMGKENHDRIFRRTHSRAPEFKNTELKPTHGQHRPDGLKTEHYRTGLHSPGEKASDSIEPISRDLSPQSPHTSPDSSTVSLPSNFLCDTHSLSSVLDTNEANFSDTVSESINDQEEFMSSCPLPVSPLGSIAARFLEEVELRSHHILERLDAHIEELKRESEKTVKQFTVFE